MAELQVDNSFNAINPAVTNQAQTDAAGDGLEQSDFIELLVAQVKNQDPTKPMDPSQFMNQLTQSSMVNGINELQKSFDTLASKLSADQSLQAAGLVGKSALLSGGEALLEPGQTVNGQLNLERQASEVTLNIYNSFGEQVRSLPLGGHGAGEVQFQWDGFGDGGAAMPPGHYLVTAEVMVDGNQEAAEVFLESSIDSISINQSVDGEPSGTLLNLASGHSVSLNEVQQIR